MKKVVLGLLLGAAVSTGISANDTKKVDLPECKQNIEGRVLRYMGNYTFYETFSAGKKDAYMNNFWVYFKHPEYLDKGTSFAWTQDLKKAAYRVPAGTSMRIFDSGKVNWKIVKHPKKRTDATHDFVIVYKTLYDYSNTPQKREDDMTKVDCVYYSVSWCGDGIVDEKDEQCDPGREKDKKRCNPKTCTYN